MKILGSSKIILIGIVISKVFLFDLYPQVKNSINKISESPSEIMLAKESDLVIIGTVKDVKDLPAPSTEMFHSMVNFHIDSILKGETSRRDIIIRLQSGPITNAEKPGTIIAWSNEPKFIIGERFVLFLNNTKRDPYLNSKFVKKTYKTFDSRKNISELSGESFWVRKERTFQIMNETIFYFNEKIKEVEFINKIIKQN